MAQVILRLTLSTNAIGPFNIYQDDLTNLIQSNVTRDQLMAGVVLDLIGSPEGVTHNIILENKQVGCENETIIKEIEVFDSTPLPTPTNTPTPTVTSTPTPTVTPTVTSTPAPSGTPAPTQTPTPSNGTFTGLLLIEPISLLSQVTDKLLELGITFPDFLGFTNAYFPTSSDALHAYMQLFAEDLVGGLQWYPISIPSTGDRAYLFDEISLPAGTVPEKAWYTFVIPDESMGGNILTQIEKGTTSSYGTTIHLESSLYNFGTVNYTGPLFANKNYRFYSTWSDQALRLDNTSEALYFRGKFKITL
jgi:hypothetical protein